MRSEKTIKLLSEKIHNISPDNDNENIIALYQAMNQCLKVNSAQEAMQLLKDSSRVYQDLLRACKQEKWDIQILVREWIDIPVQSEFRAFVYNKKIRAISQYYDVCFFPELIQDKENIIKRIQYYFETIKDKIPMEHCILDLLVLKDRIKIVELNPYGSCTGSAMFSWKTEAKLLREGLPDGSFEFRITTAPSLEATKELKSGDFHELLQSARDPKNHGCDIM